MAVTVQVSGLKEAAKNLEIIGKVGATELSRKALLDATLVLVRAIKAATYTTGFIRRTGFLKSGFGARIAHELKSGVLRGYVVQYPQNLSGSSAEKQAQRAAHLPRAKGGKQSLMAWAHYWQFLEFGTKGRRSARTPKGTRISKRTGLLNLRTRRALARYDAAKSLGDIAPHPWVRPAFGEAAPGSITTFGTSFRKRLYTAVSNLPKK